MLNNVDKPMDRSNLVNHKFTYKNTELWVKADNGSKLYIWTNMSKHLVKDKAKFLQAVDSGQIEFEKVGAYGFELHDFSNFLENTLTH